MIVKFQISFHSRRARSLLSVLFVGRCCSSLTEAVLCVCCQPWAPKRTTPLLATPTPTATALDDIMVTR